MIMLVLTSPAFVYPTQPPGLTVHVFLSTECPISQQYARQLTDLQRRYEPLGIRFVAWFPLRTDSPRTIRQFQTEYKLLFAGKPDHNSQLARQLRVRITPEVVVMQAEGRVRYQGAIDDWYVTLGKHRSEATQHFLRDALDALLTGRDVAMARTDAVGCLVE
jgi:peroxiredoxin